MSELAILGQEVPPARLNQALRDLWGDETGKTRASLMNLVIYSEDQSLLEEQTEALATLTREHACRALLIVNTPQAEPASTRSWVTAHCQLYDGKRSVCCEQLSFKLTGGSADQLRNTIYAHLDSDLPLVMWWQAPLSDRLDDRLLNSLDALFIDSSGWTQPAPDLTRLHQARLGRTSRFVLNDLAWMRSHSLRTAVAGAFQNASLRSEIANLDRLTVTHGPGHRMSALLLVAWFGTQFRCQPVGDTLTTKSGAALRWELRESPSSGAVQELELAGPGVNLKIRRDASTNFIRTALHQGASQTNEVQPGNQDSDAELITEQLSRLGGTTKYFEVWPLLQQLLG
jgi:glucose-6-phosphate dehydrogenase assembly protein OpcA